MRTAIVYSSKTGNTKKVAEAIFDSVEGEKGLYDVKENPKPDEFDWIVLGFWVNRGMPENDMVDYMDEEHSKRHQEAASHPGSEDLARAQSVFRSLQRFFPG